MLRRLLIIGLIAQAILVAGFSAGASAQDCTYNGATVACGPTPTVVGGLGNSFAESGGPSAEAVPTAVPTAEATEDTAAPELAFTGSESEVLAYVGSGLIAAGSVALVVRRRITRD